MTEKEAHELIVKFNNIRIKHIETMLALNATLRVYSCLLSNTEDKDLHKALEKLEMGLVIRKVTTENYLFGALLYTAVTELELYLVDVLNSIFKTFPQKVKNMKFDFSYIVDKSNEEIIQAASEKYINELMYKKPLEYLESFCKIISINSKKIKENWKGFIEAKARRDLGLHNDWIVNEIYIRKLIEIGSTSEVPLGKTIYANSNYVSGVLDDCEDLIEKIHSELVRKFKPQ